MRALVYRALKGVYMNEKLALEIEKRLITKFKNPLHYLDSYNEYIFFNYPHYFDDGRFNKQIQKETDFLLKQKEYLEKNKFTGFYWVNEFVIHINI
jgi:hypothetical protein